jgi:signal transduction histidine kinase
MSAGLAHEFKNAMAALHGYAQFLQSIDHDEQGKVAADALLQEVRNLSDMTTSFLNFARPQPLQLEDVSLEELIQECARELSPLFESLRVDLEIEAPSSRESQRTDSAPASRRTSEAVSQQSSSPTVKEGASTALELRADTRMLRQALLNIIRNAAEAIPQQQSNRRVTIRTSIETDQAHQWVTISIQDTGAGIAPADLQKIFIPFFTTKTQGHGIGLALAHRVITEHGGSLAVVNNPAGGATFTIRLPR